MKEALINLSLSMVLLWRGARRRVGRSFIKDGVEVKGYVVEGLIDTSLRMVLKPWGITWRGHLTIPQARFWRKWDLEEGLANISSSNVLLWREPNEKGQSTLL